MLLTRFSRRIFVSAGACYLCCQGGIRGLALAFGAAGSVGEMPKSSPGLTYPVADTGQERFFDNFEEIDRPEIGDAFFGQDAHFRGNPPSYQDNGDGTVTDLVTGLMWEKGYRVVSWEEARRAADSCRLAGFDDWRLPTIKELYSLVLFSGVDPSGPDMSRVPEGARPFIHPVFDFQYGSNGPRIIDTQLLSCTLRRFRGQPFVYGLNVADGRIKSYPVIERGGSAKKFTVRFVRGNPDYGKNRFVDNGDGTITDLATGLMWEKGDSGKGMTWSEALEWAQQKNRSKHLGYSDWRLPDAKELQSIVDYLRPQEEPGAPAIADVFHCTPIINEAGRKDYPYFWTSTTHESVRRGGADAVYLCFGEGLGYFAPMGAPREPIDIHGPGAQRSDPKTGDPKAFPRGRGPQGDVVRIFNFVRLVRTVAAANPGNGPG